MDVHKESIDVSLTEEGRSGEVRRCGAIPGDLEAVAEVLRALRAPTRQLGFVYEPGPCKAVALRVAPGGRHRLESAPPF